MALARDPDMLDALIVRPSACRPGRCTSTPSTSPATDSDRALRDRALEEALLSARRAGDDGARAAFAYMQARAGMVGVKVFLGIMLGIFFHMLNSLFSHIGLLQNWPPLSPPSCRASPS